ncbi:hypothetical protein C7387_0385 [Yokenella regensburgei]|jgi:hypothetical protein|uniref:Uncharacterized protein n=1 Tax=Yokenella regensburgei TaxID=158877 RepID=A0ABX9S252_9ENTR|nr:hypothetical protein [Yokenella regensburgei]RKR63722.1 hypothetical protein C7387_0385 [Yokenella regensburgei]VFS31891.1 Uncharacterised protein [Yokenella regensburgei]
MSTPFCPLNNFTPSPQTIAALQEIEQITRTANLLDILISACPLFQIFAGRGSYTGLATGAGTFNIATYDWDTLQRAFSSVQNLKTERLDQIIHDTLSISSGEDKKFWECMYRASR